MDENGLEQNEISHQNLSAQAMASRQQKAWIKMATLSFMLSTKEVNRARSRAQRLRPTRKVHTQDFPGPVDRKA